MPIINFSNPFSIFVGVILFVLVLYLAKTNKKAWITGTMLFASFFRAPITPATPPTKAITTSQIVGEVLAIISELA